MCLRVYVCMYVYGTHAVYSNMSSHAQDFDPLTMSNMVCVCVCMCTHAVYSYMSSHAQDFDPPDYEQTEEEGKAPLKAGFKHHPPDFIMEGTQGNHNRSSMVSMYLHMRAQALVCLCVCACIFQAPSA